MSSKFLAFVGAAAVFAVAACGGGTSAAGGGGFPSRDLTIIAASDPGGGLDLASRAVQTALQTERLVDKDLQVEGIGGGGGNPARAALLGRPKDGYTVVAESNRVFLNPLTGTTDLDVDDFTPVAKLMTEYLVWVVKGDSRWQSARDVLDALERDPRAVNFGVATVPSDDQFNILGPVQKAGVDVRQLNVVTFSGGGDLLTNLLGGRVDVVSTGVGELAGFADSSDVKIIAVSAPEPQTGVLEGVPTWHDVGVDFTLDHWRGLFGPAGMPQEAVDWWAAKLEEMARSKTWLDELAKHGWTPDYQGPADFTETVNTQRAAAEELIKTLGLGS